ncbi:ring-cleaving dioxygenase [Bacillus sonorensis]|uniref:Hydroquinone-specific dioxygenase MhqA n=2 Tax=Bacillus sonorensis TaxID=119858 RepID=M5P5C3_9BACI|nr:MULTISPECIES: ring-cleaving dioxygenase [Bacillus]TWK73024.1 putative ring-cleaving dioxygenase MhqA [Bacillus paralicheniformis]ASB89970.1 Putative ring-cleaving dioxygenase MhqA [Bacillus sonorensis]EME74643.1 hydroquinone-specific dioxygenase MhqA [Bacillus sonorensis L12]MBG9916813.1 ring-cleaving dioxygenase [Bacillus sonorensis]MCF7619220.1 ring-cleaving dioxygenase [Bacillus sonorensis]
MKVNGIHHVSALTAHAQKNYDFYVKGLGMKLIKKSVNQDEPTMYHLFYGDEVATPGSDLTFFEIPMLARRVEGTNCISSVSLRVPGEEALRFWEKRLDELGVAKDSITKRAGRSILRFLDPEGQNIILTADENGKDIGVPVKNSVIPGEFAIRGLGPVELSVADTEPTAAVLTDILGFKQIAEDWTETNQKLLIFESGEGGAATEIHVKKTEDLRRERPGRGSVHHVAFRVKDEEELQKWHETISAHGFTNSGIVERYYFKALYFREPNGILFELSTDGPGFAVDEDIDHLGQSLALPPYLENRRKEIEARLTPIQTTM